VRLSGDCTSAMKAPRDDFHTPLTVISFTSSPDPPAGRAPGGGATSPPRDARPTIGEPRAARREGDERIAASRRIVGIPRALRRRRLLLVRRRFGGRGRLLRLRLAGGRLRRGGAEGLGVLLL